MEQINMIIHEADNNLIYTKDTLKKNIVKYLFLILTISLTSAIMILDFKAILFKNNKNIILSVVSILAINWLSIITTKRIFKQINSIYTNLIFCFIIIGFEFFIFFYIRNIKLNSFIELQQLIYILVFPIMGMKLLWDFNIYIKEKDVQPLFSKGCLYNSISIILAGISMGIGYWVVWKYSIIGKNDSFQFLKLSNIIMLLFIWITFMFAIYYKLISIFKYSYKKLNELRDERLFNIIPLLIITPAIIWYIYNFNWVPPNTYDLIFILLPIFSILITFIFAFYKKGEIGSSRVFNVISCTSLLMIWTNKLVFEIYANIYLSFQYTTLITLIATNFISLFLVMKSNSVKKVDIFSYIWFGLLCTIMVIATTFLNKLGIKLDLFLDFNINELFNSIIITSASFLTIRSIVLWYLSIRRINKYFLKKEIISDTIIIGQGIKLEKLKKFQRTTNNKTSKKGGINE